jgi:hypothetical protein
MTSLLILLASAVTAEDGLAWQETPHSLALVRGAQVVWQFNYNPEDGKPYFHPVTIGGGAPVTDLRPADHYWHRAIWFSWKSINGLVYWEENPQTGKSPGETEMVAVKATPRGDHSAQFELAIHYHPPGRPAVLTERRIVTVGAPTPAGTYSIDWLSVFTAGDADVLLDRTPIAGEPNGVSWGGYAGLSLRLTPELRRWQFSDSDGPVNEVTKQARWIAFSGPTRAGETAAIIVLDHPDSFRHPTPWYLIQGMPYFSPAVLYRSPHTLRAQESLTLKYRMIFQAAAVDREAVDREWEAFAAGR